VQSTRVSFDYACEYEDEAGNLGYACVAANSPAARAGIKAGDRLGAAEGRRLFSQTDFRGALHRGPRDTGSIDVVWLRDQAESLRRTIAYLESIIDARGLVAGAGYYLERPTRIEFDGVAQCYTASAMGLAAGLSWGVMVKSLHRCP